MGCKESKQTNKIRYSMATGLDKPKNSAKNCKYFLTHNLEHMFWVLKRTKIVNIFLHIILSIFFGCLKEPSLEYLQHMLWLRSKKVIFSVMAFFTFNSPEAAAC